MLSDWAGIVYESLDCGCQRKFFGVCGCVPFDSRLG